MPGREEGRGIMETRFYCFYCLSRILVLFGTRAVIPECYFGIVQIGRRSDEKEGQIRLSTNL